MRRLSSLSSTTRIFFSIALPLLRTPAPRVQYAGRDALSQPEVASRRQEFDTGDAIRLAPRDVGPDALRAESHRRAPHRKRPHRALQLALRAPPRRRVRAAHRGHRPRALDRGIDARHPREPPLARPHLGPAALDAFIIVPSDGMPVYNFCVVVDDHDMRITHVIRGDDLLASTPRQVLLYRAFGAAPPAFAHVPQILGLDKARLSKRHGATSVLAYREMGYLPDAVVNYLARLGWSHGDQELFRREELIAHFTLENVGKSAGIFNPEKLEWVNFQYMKATPAPALAELVAPFLERAGLPVPADRAWLARVAETLRERAKTWVELAEFCRFYLLDTITPDPKAAATHLTPAIAPALADLCQRLTALPRWDAAAIEGAFQATLAAHGLKLGALAQPLRVAVTGGTVSPGIYEVLGVLGRERTIARLRAAAPRS